MSKIKIHDPFFGKEEKLAINAVLESHQWASSKGNNKVSEFEKKLIQHSNYDPLKHTHSSNVAFNNIRPVTDGIKWVSNFINIVSGNPDSLLVKEGIINYEKY